MNDQTWDFTVSLTVQDEQQLLAAAMARAAADDAENSFYPTDPDTYYREGLTHADGTPDVKACLIMLLDPGSLPGVSILESTAEVLGNG